MASLEKTAVVLVVTQVKDLIKMDLSRLCASPVAPAGSLISVTGQPAELNPKTVNPAWCDAATVDSLQHLPRTAKTSHAGARARRLSQSRFHRNHLCNSFAACVHLKGAETPLSWVHFGLLLDVSGVLPDLLYQKVANRSNCFTLILKAGVLPSGASNPTLSFLFKDKAPGCRF